MQQRNGSGRADFPPPLQLSGCGADRRDNRGAPPSSRHYCRPRPPTPAWTKIDEIIRKQVQLAIRGDMSAQEAMDQAVEQIDPLLQRG